MEAIKPSVEFVEETEKNLEHIARCAAICYDSRNYNADAMYERLLRDGHTSMFRHATVYLKVPCYHKHADVLTMYIHYSKIFGKNPYLNIHRENGIIYVSTNLQYWKEHDNFTELYNDCIVSRNEFVNTCPNKDIIRFTFICVTSVKVSRELNRVSPNNIAESSTRYINLLSKQGGATVCESFEPDYLTAVDKAIIRQKLVDACNNYDELIKSGIKPEDARRVLPFDAATKVAYTYTLGEWKHILDLRYYEKTGKAAPDAKIVAGMIHDKLIELGYNV